MLKVLAPMASGEIRTGPRWLHRWLQNSLATSRIDRKSDDQRRANDNDRHDDWQGLHNPGSLDLRSPIPKKMRLIVERWDER